MIVAHASIVMPTHRVSMTMMIRVAQDAMVQVAPSVKSEHLHKSAFTPTGAGIGR